MNNGNTSSNSFQSILYGPSGAVAVVNNANNSAVIIQNGKISNYTNPNPSSGTSNILKNPYGGTLTVSIVNNQFNMTVVDESGNKEIFTMNPTQNNLIFNINQYNGLTLNSPSGSSATINSNTISIINNGITTVYTSYNAPNVFVNPNGGTAVISPTSNNSFILVLINNQGNTQIFNPSSSNNQMNNNSNLNNNNLNILPFLNNLFSNNGISNNPNAYNPYYGSQNQNSQMSNYNPYSSALPSGIPGSQIPPGKEDLYILKSEVIPPICPACPTVKVCDKKEKCPPCPACARCPEPSFECKKVPNYSSSSYNSGYYGYNDSFDSGPLGGKSLPVPVLNDFSTFGM